MQCRACLEPNCVNTIRFDELKIMWFNSITNLCVIKGDGMPQQLCENCTRDLASCVKFREKCITSNAILLRAQTTTENVKVSAQIKQEDDDDGGDGDVEQELFMEIDTKQEIQTKDECTEAQPSGDNFVYEFVSENKQPSEDKPAKRTIAEVKTKPQTKIKNEKKQPKKIKIPQEYDCGLCKGKVARDKLKEHVVGHEGDERCGVCGELVAGGAPQHRLAHLDAPHLVCHICLRAFKTRPPLECHYKTAHMGKTEDGKKCDRCERSFATASNLYKHIREMHSDTPVKCEACSESFRTTRILQRHVNNVHKRNKCGECGFSATSNSSLRVHRLREHVAGAVSCRACRTIFASERRLAAHKCRCAAASTVCPVCGLVFPQPEKLQAHMARHSDERRYKCEQCDAAYRTWRALRVHRSKHAGVRPHTCDVCAAAFWAMPTLVKHRRLHTGERPYVCKVCGKGFTANHNLKLHMRVHGVYDLIKKKNADEGSVDKVKKPRKKRTIDEHPGESMVLV